MEGILAGITPASQSGPESNKEVTLYPSEL